jgi:hypothetical protein
MCGFFGGIGVFIVELYAIRHVKAELRPWTQGPFYWVVSALMAVLGAGLVLIYLRCGMVMNPILEVNVGATAPLFFSAAAKHLPQFPPGKID